MPTRVLITGGFGYVGGRVAQSFAKQPNYQVVLGSRQQRLPPAWIDGAHTQQLIWYSQDQLTTALNDIYWSPQRPCDIYKQHVAYIDGLPYATSGLQPSR